MFKDVCFYVTSFIYGTVLLFAIINSSIIDFITVFYYRMVFGLVISCLLSFITIKIITLYNFLNIQITYKDILISFLLLFFIHFSFISLVIVSLDRSISVLLLSEMADQKDHAFNKKELEKIYTDIYISEYDPINRRINEQLSSGNFEKINDGYKITSRGRNLVVFFRALAKVYPVNNQFLFPPKIDFNDSKTAK